jgi:SAM-dependent methyltransferase
MFGDAEAYDRFMGRWSRLLAPLFVEFSGLPDGGRVLDVGSGTGALAFAIGERKPRCQVVGIDPSKEYARYAGSRNSFGSRMTFEVGDAQALRFEDGAFDHSLSLLVFNFIPDRWKALREIIRVTKPGGIVSAAVWDYGAGMRMLRVFWDAAVAVDSGAGKLDERHMPLCRAGELEALWKQGGLHGVAGTPLDFTMKFGSFADYWEPFLLGQGPAGAYVRGLERSAREVLQGELRRRLGLAGKDVPFSLTTRAWSVRGMVPRG